MGHIFTIPDKVKNSQGYMVYVLTIIWCVVSAVIVSIGFYCFPDLWLRWLTFLFSAIFIAVFNLSLIRFGHLRLASWSLTIMLWLYMTLPCYSAGGVFAPGILSQMSVILTAGILLGWRGGLAFGVLTIFADFGMAYLEVIGQLPEPSVVHNPMTRWISAVIPFGTILALQYYATNHLHKGLIALKCEIKRSEEAEKVKNLTVHSLGERVKELRTLYDISRILQDENSPSEHLLQQIVEVIPKGLQFYGIGAASISIGETVYSSSIYRPSEYNLQTKKKTNKGTKISIEVVYLESTPQFDEGPFLEEERNLINMVADLLKVDLERRERIAELQDYKYALDIVAGISIYELDGTFSFVNDNFCKLSKYKSKELVGQQHSIIWSDYHWPEFFEELELTLKEGKPFRGEFCYKAKDGSLFWVDSSIVPLLDENGKVYQFLSINYDITERKESDKKIKENEELTRKITSQVPGNTYMFEIEESGKIRTLFFNKGTDEINHSIDLGDLENVTKKLTDLLHEDDRLLWLETMKEAYLSQKDISLQYRIWFGDQYRWRWFRAVAEKSKNGKVIWYGAAQDITPLVDYIVSIEQIIYDIGHVIRRPIATMKGMTKIINENELKKKEIKIISKKLYLISEEMDKFISELNDAYYLKSKDKKLNIDVSALIDRRGSLFE